MLEHGGRLRAATRLYAPYCGAALAWSRCGGEMRIIAFLTDAGAVRDILTDLGEPTSPPRLMPARAPPLWERQSATLGEDDPQAQPGT